MAEKTPSAITVRRNPHRRARPTPSSTHPHPHPTPHPLPSFPLQDLLDIQIHHSPQTSLNEPPTSSKPLRTTSKPLQTSAKPPEPASIPLQTSSKPLQTSAKPPEPAPIPLQTSQNEPEASSEPLQTSSEPLQTTSEPLQTTSEPPPPSPKPPSSASPTSAENLKVFLRIRPLMIQSSITKERNIGQSKCGWPKNPRLKNGGNPNVKRCKGGNCCVSVNDDGNSITISPPSGLQDSKRVKSEVYEGFSHVFGSQSTQVEVYEKLLKPLVDDFLKGKSGMLAAVGPSGSGKTHTMFGCIREPGMVPLALRDIFSSYDSKSENEPRTLYVSMFEISSEKGRSERISDLLQGGHDESIQCSTVKGVQRVVIQNAHQAEGLLACGLLKRATAGTNTNSQSSRSQCIINFRQATHEMDDQTDYSELTIVDLAGAEREKRTGNQGTRLLESNFINNTSMVFGLCLRALLEHQKNPKRQLQKHFQNSMLTRYLRDYLEGKKRMSLILTVKPSEEDYLDTSFVLRQAAPYMQIKFSNVEEPNNLTCKRPLQALNRTEPLKRRKHTVPRVSEIQDEEIIRNPLELRSRNIKDEKILGTPQIIEEGHVNGSVEDSNLIEASVYSEEFSSRKRIPMESLEKSMLPFTEADRNHKVLEGLSKAIWKVLKEYNEKLKETQQENDILNAELAKERKRCSDLESVIQDVNFRCSCGKESSESNMNDHENLQKTSSVSSIMEGSAQNSFEHARDSFEKSSSACVPSHIMVEISKRCSPQLQPGASSENVNCRPNHEASDKLMNSCLQSCKGLDKTTISNSSGDNGNNCSDEEASISSVSDVLPFAIDVLPLTNVNDSGYSEDVINVTDVGEEYIHHDDGNLTTESTTDLEIKELAGSAAPLSDSNTEILSSLEEVQHLTYSSNQESPVSSSQSLHSTTDRSLLTKVKQPEKVIQIHESSIPSDTGTSTKGATCSQECDHNNVSMAVGAPSLTKDSQNFSKPKRRLLPVSSLLLKDMSNLAIEDEIDKRKGGRGEKKVSFDEKIKSQSKPSLLQLLQRNVVH